AVTGDQLLLDGTPLDSAAAEKSFARMLSVSGISSIHFSPKVTQASLARFVRGFPTGNSSKPQKLAEQLKAALEGDPHIHVNEVCFVPADSAVAKSTIAAQLTARTLGMGSTQADELFSDPEKLLQLIVAAEGTKGGGPGKGTGTGTGGSGSGGGSGHGGSGPDNGSGGSGTGGGYATGGVELTGPGGSTQPSEGSAPGFYSSGVGRPASPGSTDQGAGFGGPASAVTAGSGGSAAGPGAGSASGTWNIVNSSGGGGGTPLDANAGGLWLGKESGGSAPASGAALSGGADVVAGGGSSGTSTGSGSGASGTWNIVNSSGGGGGTPLDANAGGFWLGKESGGGAPGGGGAAVVSGSGSSNGPSGTWNIVNTPGEGGGIPLDASAGGFWLGKEGGSASSSTGGHGPTGTAIGGPPAGGIGGTQGGQSGVAQASSAPGAAGTGRTGAVQGPKSWQVPESGGSEGSESAGGIGRWTTATKGIRGSRNARNVAPGSMSVETGLMTLHQDELQGILQVLAQIARTNEGDKDKLDPSAFQSRLSTLPRRARFTVSQALSALAAQAPSESSDRPTLMKLAEHIAIRYALESYERGDIEVNTVRTMLDDMSQELDGLRKILGVYEEKMARAGIEVQSHVDMLAQQFWAQVTEEKKKNVLESSDAWCVPPQKVREYVEALIKKEENEPAENILSNYASCMTAKSPESRRQSAMGVAELASLYAKLGDRLLVSTIRQAGVQLAEETDSELQSVLGAAFVRLSQEATKKRAYSAVQRAVELVDYVETERPGVGKNLRPRLSVEDRLPEFIEEAVKSGNVPGGLTDLLRRIPGPAADHLAKRFSRAGFRDDCDLLISMVNNLGPEGLQHLRQQLLQGRTAEALDAVGLLARVDLEMLEQALPAKLREWKRTSHDRLVRQIAASGSPERGRLLLSLFDQIDSLIRPLAVDEIGLSSEQLADMKLVRLAEGDLPSNGTAYLQLKAIEALGRLRTAGAEPVLRKIAETKKVFGWASASELRVVATQAMEKIDPEWAKSFLPQSGLSVAELSLEVLDPDPNSAAIRQRRYPRMRLDRPVPATTTNLKENCRMEIPELTLGGGVAVCETTLHPGTVLGIRMNPGQKPVKAQAIVRDANTQARAFEVVEMDLEERAKLRKMLVQLGNVLKQTTPQERSRRGTRTLLTSQS
ncbi:MAG TPA: hypothetical protein VMB47_06755, partial [Candidatus Aquilonibacter sp.]|nr:hypothetical protein [Candidatus Aquilonibacter sp.]